MVRLTFLFFLEIIREFFKLALGGNVRLEDVLAVELLLTVFASEGPNQAAARGGLVSEGVTDANFCLHKEMEPLTKSKFQQLLSRRVS